MNDLKKAMNESALLRWGMLVLVSITMFANYYFYDALSPLKGILETRMHWNSSNYGFFVSAYSIPNVFLSSLEPLGKLAATLGLEPSSFDVNSVASTPGVVVLAATLITAEVRTDRVGESLEQPGSAKMT